MDNTTPQPTDGAIALAFRDVSGDPMLRSRQQVVSAIEVRAAEIDAARPAQLGGGVVSDELIERALHATVPGGGQVWCWLPSVDAWTPHQTARNVMRAALEAALGKGGA